MAVSPYGSLVYSLRNRFLWYLLPFPTMMSTAAVSHLPAVLLSTGMLASTARALSANVVIMIEDDSGNAQHHFGMNSAGLSPQLLKQAEQLHVDIVGLQEARTKTGMQGYRLIHRPRQRRRSTRMLRLRTMGRQNHVAQWLALDQQHLLRPSRRTCGLPHLPFR